MKLTREAQAALLQPYLRITRVAAKVIVFLYNAEEGTYWQSWDIGRDVHAASVNQYAHRIRDALGKDTILSIPHKGYYLSDTFKEKIREILEEKIYAPE